MALSLNTMPSSNKTIDLEFAPISNDSVAFWEKEKQKCLESRIHIYSRLEIKHNWNMGRALPRWQKRLRKRLGKVQILLGGLQS